MTQPTSVTVEGMQRATADFQTAHAQATTDRARIEGELASLRAPVWSGEASDVFQMAGQAWLSHMTAIIGGLESLQRAMQEGGVSYDSYHNQTVDSASQARNMLQSAQPGPLQW